MSRGATLHTAPRQAGDRADPPAPRPVPAARRGARARARRPRRRAEARARRRVVPGGALPGTPDHAGRSWSRRWRRPAPSPPSRPRRTAALAAGIDDVRFKRIVEPGDELELTCELERVRGPVGAARTAAEASSPSAERSRSRSPKTHDRQRHRERRRRRHHGARRICPLSVCLRTATSRGWSRPRRVDRHAHGNPRAAYRRARAGGKRSLRCRRHGRRSSTRACARGARPRHRGHGQPDMLFPATAPIVADALGARQAAAYDLLAGCTGFVYALSQAYGQVTGSLQEGSSSAPRFSRGSRTGGTARPASLRRRRRRRGRPADRQRRHHRLRAGADGSGGPDLCVPAGVRGSRSRRTCSRTSSSSSG